LSDFRATAAALVGGRGLVAETVIQSLMAAMVQILRTFALVASLVVPVAGGAQAQPASVNDTARLLAGMQPSPDSPLLALTKEQAWQQYATRFDAIFANMESRQLTRIRAWSRAKLTSPSPVLFYMFSGPDNPRGITPGPTETGKSCISSTPCRSTRSTNGGCGNSNISVSSREGSLPYDTSALDWAIPVVFKKMIIFQRFN
jgi:hypothetical protein